MGSVPRGPTHHHSDGEIAEPTVGAETSERPVIRLNTSVVAHLDPWGWGESMKSPWQ